MPTTTVNGVELYYEVHGDRGEPLVLVHGYTGDITDWRHQLPEFSRTHRVLIIDNRGHGRSEAPTDRASYSVLQIADDVEAVADQVGFGRYHLLGHSMGGAVAQEIALRRPGRLMSLALHDTSHRFGVGRNALVQKWIDQRHKLAEEQGMAAVAEMPAVTKPPPHLPKERQAETKARLTRMSVDAFIAAWRALEEWQGTEQRAKNISVPTMVLYGDLDGPLVDAAKFLAAEIPGAVLEVVPETGHQPQWERPELYNAALRRHLDRNAGAAAK